MFQLSLVRSFTLAGYEFQYMHKYREREREREGGREGEIDRQTDRQILWGLGRKKTAD